MLEGEEPRAHRRRLLWTGAVILVLALAAYWPALRGTPVWDDDGHITKTELQSLPGLWRIWTDLGATQQYYPLLHSAFWLEHLLWGDAPLGYHLANLIEHAAAALLLIVLLERLRVPGATLAGILFTVHPVCVESVAWISEQKNTLSLVFYLLSALAYLRFDGDRGAPGARGAYRRASVLFALALLTKTVTATLPAALLVVAWWKRGSISRDRDVKPLVPWFAASLLFAVLTSWVEHSLIGAEGSAFDIGSAGRVLLAGRVVWFYLGTLLWPSDLMFVYPRWNPDAAGFGWGLCLLAALAVTGSLWLLRRRTRGPLAAWLFYVGSLFPALGFINVYPFVFSYVADHFQYLASLGFFASVGAAYGVLLRGRSRNTHFLAASGAGMAAVVLCLVSNTQSAMYADEPTLYRATLAKNPGCWMAENNLGLWYKTHGDSKAAADHYHAALRLRRDYAQAHNNLGVCLDDDGNTPGAVAEYREALRIKPNFTAAHNNLGSALAKIPGHEAEALAEFREALRLQPGFASAHDNLGTALLRTPGGTQGAIREYREAIRLKPDFAKAHADLGSAYLGARERLEEAVAEFGESLRLQPGNPEVLNNLGLTQNALGRPSDAIDSFSEALRIRPGFVEIRFNLALALLAVPGREREAAAQFQVFLEAHPENETARHFLTEIRAAVP
jgi:Flp pilus assembly protein TadD